MGHYVIRLGCDQATRNTLSIVQHRDIEVLEPSEHEDLFWKVKAHSVVSAMKIVMHSFKAAHVSHEQARMLDCSRLWSE